MRHKASALLHPITIALNLVLLTVTALLLAPLVPSDSFVLVCPPVPYISVVALKASRSGVIGLAALWQFATKQVIHPPTLSVALALSIQIVLSI
jgi:hypothetical protein